MSQAVRRFFWHLPTIFLACHTEKYQYGNATTWVFRKNQLNLIKSRETKQWAYKWHLNNRWKCENESVCRSFSREEYWSGLPFPSPGDCSYPGINQCFFSVLQHQKAHLPWRRFPLCLTLDYNILPRVNNVIFWRLLSDGWWLYHLIVERRTKERNKLFNIVTVIIFFLYQNHLP